MRFPETRARAIQITATAGALARQGHEVLLFVRKSRETRVAEGLRRYGLERVRRLEVIPLRWPRDARWVLRFRLLRERRHRPILYLRQIEPYAVTLVSAARRMGVPVIFEAHGVKHLIERERARGDESRVKPWIEMERQVVENATGLITTTTHTERMLRTSFRITAPTAIIPNGAPPVEPEGSRREIRDLDLLYAGQLYSWKGTQLLFGTLARLPGITLHVVGGNRPEDLAAARNSSVEQGVGNRVVFHGQVPPAEVASFLRRARCGIVPLPGTGSIEAKYFTSPLKLFELQAAGAPVVASDLPSIREALGGVESALLAAPDDPAAFAQAVRRILEDPGLAERLSSNGRAAASTHGWDRRARDIGEFLDTVVPLE